jgi:predicted RND superfamily exporter protein
VRDRFLQSVLTGARRHASAVVASAIVATGVGIVLVSRLSFDADVLRLLPQDAPAVRSFRTFLADFGSLDHLYVVFESPDGIGEHADLVHAYIAALRQAPEIESVDAQLFEPSADWTYLFDRVLFLLGPSGAAGALDRLHPQAIGGWLGHARDLLSMPSAEIKAHVQQDPLDLLGLVRERMARQKGTLAGDPTAEGYVSPDGHSRLVIVKPRGAPFDTSFCKALFRRLDEVERGVRTSAASAGLAGAEVTIQAAGAYRASLEAEALIKRDTLTNSVGSLVLLLILVFAVFRTPWVMVFGIIPLALAALLALGLNGVLRGNLSPATSGSAGMLFGLGIDGIILLYLRYLEERHAGRSPIDATGRMAGTASSVVLAQATTAVTFFALIVIDFPTLQDLGALVGLGMLLVCVFTPVLLPALLASGPAADRGRVLVTPWLGRFVTRRSAAIVWVSVLATLILAAASTHLHLDARIDRLQANTPDVALEHAIADRFSLPRDVLLVLSEHEHLEALLEAHARLRERLAQRDPAIATSGIGLLLPSVAEQDQVAREIRASAMTAAGVERDVRLAGNQVGFRPDTFAPFFERLPRLLDPDQPITFDGLVAHGLGPVVSRFLVQRDGAYVGLTYLYPQQPPDLPALEQMVREVDAQAQLTGLGVVNYDAAQRFLPEFLKGMTIGTVAVALLIYAVFRTIRHTVLALLPTAVGFVWSAGLLALLRVDLDVFSLFAAVTFVGIAVDYGIYVLYRHLADGTRDIGDVLSRTGGAIIVAGLAAIIGFGTLVNSSYRPLRTFGIVSIVTLTCCLAASLVLLPAVILQVRRRP